MRSSSCSSCAASAITRICASDQSASGLPHGPSCCASSAYTRALLLGSARMVSASVRDWRSPLVSHSAFRHCHRSSRVAAGQRGSTVLRPAHDQLDELSGIVPPRSRQLCFFGRSSSIALARRSCMCVSKFEMSSGTTLTAAWPIRSTMTATLVDIIASSISEILYCTKPGLCGPGFVRVLGTLGQLAGAVVVTTQWQVQLGRHAPVRHHFRSRRGYIPESLCWRSGARMQLRRRRYPRKYCH